MSHGLSNTLAIRQIAKLVLPAAVAAFLALGTSPARADDTQVQFGASYHGQSTVHVDEASGYIRVDAVLPGQATFMPGSWGYFDQGIDPLNPTRLNGAFLLFGNGEGSVFGTYQGTQTVADEYGIVLISGAYELEEGWLQGLGAALGRGAISGEFNVNTGQMSIRLMGTVSPATPTPS